MSYVIEFRFCLGNMHDDWHALPEVLHLLLKQASLGHMAGGQHLIHITVSVSCALALQTCEATNKSAQWPLPAPFIICHLQM